MDNEIINELLEVDLKVRTNKNEEQILCFTDFKNLKDVTISYDSYQDHDEYGITLPPVLKEIKITIPCNGCSLEILNT